MVSAVTSPIQFPALRVLTGPAETSLADLTAVRGWRRVAVLAGPGVSRSAGIAQRLETIAGCHLRLWLTGPTHAPVASVEALAAEVREYDPDVLVSIGGGSCHDLNKGVATLLAHGGSLLDYCLRFDPPEDLRHTAIPGPKLPIVTVPSTLSGSEANGAAGFAVPEIGRKRVLADPSLFPTAILVDRTILDTTPAEIFQGSAMNALNHAVEGLASRRRNVASEALLAKAFAELSAATEDEVDRERASIASVLAGVGLSGSWLGLAHAIGHVLGARYAVPHGWCHAVMAGDVVRFNSTVAAAEHAATAALVGAHPSSAGLADWLDARAERWKLPRSLGELGVPEADLVELAEAAWHDHDSFYNPRRATREDILSVLRNAF